ncbi:MAG: aspartate--tRNA ligase, partial [Clostridia bacterium]|nr:aspartate--tRNA ligase [Clostridia bacterium]
QVTRNYFTEQGFWEIETPMLTKSTPEGARDYLVPSRVHPGAFYALPQSPQQYKQMLMLSGVDRYMQIARCFRDEDLRADRQPEFTQIDLEMSFVDMEDIMAIQEGFIKKIFKELRGVDVETPILRLTYAEAMSRFGSDKPDMRFGFELRDISDLVKDSGFTPFVSAIENGGSVHAINFNEVGGKMSRKEIDSLGEYVKTYRAKGLAWAKVTKDGVTSSFAKNMPADVMTAIYERMNIQEGDLLAIIAHEDTETAQTALGALRCEVARRQNLISTDDFKFLWVTDFPLFEKGEDDDGNERFYAKHHPFTSPRDEDIPLFETAPEKMMAKAYDIVCNGYEMGGGSIRIHDPEVQQKMFNCLGFTTEDTLARFGHMIDAFKFGAPPHGGIAYGFDRIVMLLAGTEDIRDSIAFPKIQTASEVMTSCPSEVEEKQLRELCIKVDLPVKEEKAE